MYDILTTLWCNSLVLPLLAAPFWVVTADHLASLVSITFSHTNSPHVLLHFIHYLLLTFKHLYSNLHTPTLSEDGFHLLCLHPTVTFFQQQLGTSTALVAVLFGLGCSCSHLEMSFLMICIFNLAKIVRVIDLPDTMFSISLGLGLACDGSVAAFVQTTPSILLSFCTDMSCLVIYACRLQVSQAYGTICQSMVTLRVLLWSKHQYCELFKAFPYLSKLNSRRNQRSSLGFITMYQACFDTKRNVESKAQLHFTFS